MATSQGHDSLGLLPRPSMRRYSCRLWVVVGLGWWLVWAGEGGLVALVAVSRYMMAGDAV